jgi:zinc protease
MKNAMKILMHSKKVLFSVLLALVVVALHAQLPANIVKGASVEGMTEYNLKSNGLKVLLFPDQTKQTVTVNITYLVGSRHEGYGETGMAHLLEHLVFKGTPKHKDVPGEMKQRGAQFNGTTSVDRTNYYETVSATDENLEWALDLESDRMVNSFIAKKDLDSEFSVVRNEFESGENDPASILNERVMSTAFLWHNYGKSTIGNRSDIENVPIENLQAFYRRFYQPDNAVLLVAGKFDADKTLKLIDKYYSAIPKPTRAIPTTYSTEPTQDGERYVTLKRVGDLQVAAAGYHVPAGSHPDYIGMSIIADCLTDNPSGRLYKNLVASNKAAGVSSLLYPTKDPGFVYFSTDVRKEGNLEEAKNILLKTLDDLVTNPLSEEDIKRTKTQTLKQFEELFRDSRSTGQLMSEFIALGDWRMFFIIRDNFEKITAADVARIAKTYLKPSNRTVGLFIPETKPDRAEIPSTPDISAVTEGYKGKALMDEGEVFDPSATNIESRTKRGVAGFVKYAFLSKKTRGNTINANLTLRFGDEKSLAGKRLVSEILGQMLKKGTAKQSEQQIKDALDNLKASVGISTSKDNTYISIETVRDNLPAVLKLVTEMLKESTLPEKEFTELRQKLLAQTEQQLSDPDALAQSAMDRHMNPYPKGDIRYTMSLQEELDALKTVKLEDVRRFYKGFYGASDATLAIVGEFDENKAKQIITEGLGSWKSPMPYKRIETKFFDPKPVNEAIKTPDKANAIFLAGQNIAINDTDPDYAATWLGNYVFGAGGLSNRLANRIRQKEGLSYGVGSWFTAEALDKAGTFGAYAIYAPENLAKLEAAFKEEMAAILKDGITQKELDEAKTSIKQARLIVRSNDKQLVGKLNTYLFLNRTMQWDINYEGQIMKLSVEDVNKALKKAISLDKISLFKGGDFDKPVKP